MKKESQRRSDVFFLATQNVAVHVKEPYRIQRDFIETENFVPEAFMMHHLQRKEASAVDSDVPLSEGWLAQLNPLKFQTDFTSPINTPFAKRGELALLADEDDKDGEEFDEEDDDEDWDDDDEDDEDWDEEEDEDWDEDEEWEEDDDEDDEDEDWEEEEEE